MNHCSNIASYLLKSKIRVQNVVIDYKMATKERLNRVGYVIAAQNDGPDEVDFVRLRPKKRQEYQQNRESRFTRGIRESLAFIQETLSDGILGFITIKVILWDIFITLADITSDFIQGYTLFRTPGKSTFGIISLAINWIPGVVASIHLLSTLRTTTHKWHKVVLYALLLLVFYPISK